MKIKMLAVSIAALASSGAFAQSNVTLYGVVDVGVEYLTHAGGNHDVVRLSSGNYSGSRWGLRGTEDLGGGLKGIFTLESGFKVDTGGLADSSRLFNRAAFIGLEKNGFGRVTVGHQQTLLYDFSLIYDPMAIATNYSLLSQDPAFANRVDNAIKYVGTFGGLTAAALYSFRTDGQEVPGSSRGAEYSAGLNYAVGPMSLGVAYDQVRLGLNPGADKDAKVQRATLGGTYAFGPTKLFAGWRWANQTAPDQHVRSNLTWGGVAYQAMPALTLTGAVYYQDFHRTSADPWTLVASADYALSKRTDIYLNMAYTINSKDNNSYSVVAGVNGSDLPPLGTNQFGAVVGIRHTF